MFDFAQEVDRSGTMSLKWDKYKGQDVTAKMMDKVRKGGAGVYGPVPMPPTAADKINDADLKKVIEWVLKG